MEKSEAIDTIEMNCIRIIRAAEIFLQQGWQIKSIAEGTISAIYGNLLIMYLARKNYEVLLHVRAVMARLGILAIPILKTRKKGSEGEDQNTPALCLDRGPRT